MLKRHLEASAVEQESGFYGIPRGTVIMHSSDGKVAKNCLFLHFMRKTSFHAKPKSKVPVANALIYSLSLTPVCFQSFLFHLFTSQHHCLHKKGILKLHSTLLVKEVLCFREWALSLISKSFPPPHFMLHSCASSLLSAAGRMTVGVVTVMILLQHDSWGGKHGKTGNHFFRGKLVQAR